MTDTQKVAALVELLGEVIHSLDMKQFEIEDPTEAHKCETEAWDYSNRMISILHSEDS